MKLILYITIIFSTLLISQTPSSEWVPVDTKENSKVYFDKQTLKVIGNKIAVFVLESFNTPVMNSSIQLNTSSIKTYYFFYLPKKRFTTIGTIYYDQNGSMIGETKNSRQTSIDEIFPNEIETDVEVKTIYDGVLSYLDNNNITYFKTETKEDKRINPPPGKTENDDIVISDQKIKEPESQKEEPKQNTEERVKKSGSYDDRNERIVKGTIFSDGSTFVVQVSSWPDKNKAATEVTKLMRAGHNAFMTEAYVSQKRGTWYRVRVGYFLSLDEAEKYQRNYSLK
ncbi:MAG: SPOR domain-containing protein [Ignavibacteriaceae bacterium]